MKLTWIFLTISLGAAAAWYGEHRAVVDVRRQIGQSQHRTAELQTRTKSAEADVAERRIALRRAEEKLDAVEAELAVESRFGPPPAKVWRERIQRLQNRLAKSGGAIPELALLQLKDWIDAAVRAEGGDDAELERVFGALRQTARIRVVQRVQEALRKYVDHNGGALPEHVTDLMPYLEPPITAEMLAGYSLRRAGKVEKRDEKVVDVTFGRQSVAISLDAWTFETKAALPDADELLSGLGAFTEHKGLSVETFKQTFQKALEAVGPLMAQAIPEGEHAQFGAKLKAAVRQYGTAHGAPPATMADLADTLPDAVALAEHIRPVLAELEYAIDHQGVRATSPAALKRYLEAVDVREVLRKMKLTVVGDSVNLDFGFGY